MEVNEFSKYEISVEIVSIYFYKDTNVLKNKLKIKDSKTLKEAEEQIVAVRQYDMIINPIQGKFTKKHLMKIHSYLFSDIFYFGGKIRKEQISKGDTMFYPVNDIKSELDKVFTEIKCFLEFNENTQFNIIDRLSYFMAKLNIIHPFREGNGRAIREFIRLLAMKHNIKINWGNIDHRVLLTASIKSVNDYSLLINIIKECIE